MFIDQVRDFLLDIVLLPGVWLSLILVLIYAAAYTAWRSDKIRLLGANLLAALAGFCAGQIMGDLLGIDIARFGQVQLLLGSMGAWLALPIVRLRLWRHLRRT